ncbi:hypothetical protein BD289DRAFT_275443 [Coniella lustricola]|uniref:Uncharacterized protein n=1 Tax=Coniella lustricola TaxID=2025994 RepID=A0A2T3A6T7_9PEZI|nr:hypothetical protein BD289DRAFT_275443 [Coniella lustricola]
MCVAIPAGGRGGGGSKLAGAGSLEEAKSLGWQCKLTCFLIVPRSYLLWIFDGSSGSENRDLVRVWMWTSLYTCYENCWISSLCEYCACRQEDTGNSGISTLWYTGARLTPHTMGLSSTFLAYHPSFGSIILSTMDNWIISITIRTARLNTQYTRQVTKHRCFPFRSIRLSFKWCCKR